MIKVILMAFSILSLTYAGISLNTPDSDYQVTTECIDIDNLGISFEHGTNTKEYCFAVVCRNQNTFYEIGRARAHSQAKRIVENRNRNCRVRDAAMRMCR